MSGHTPGPWFISGPFIGPRIAPNSGLLLKAARVSGDETDAESIANARLIAAAPELLEALETAMQWIKAWDVGFLFDEEWPADEAKINAAIAKARGAA